MATEVKFNQKTKPTVFNVGNLYRFDKGDGEIRYYLCCSTGQTIYLMNLETGERFSDEHPNVLNSQHARMYQRMTQLQRGESVTLTQKD